MVSTVLQAWIIKISESWSDKTEFGSFFEDFRIGWPGYTDHGNLVLENVFSFKIQPKYGVTGTLDYPNEAQIRLYAE